MFTLKIRSAKRGMRLASFGGACLLAVSSCLVLADGLGLRVSATLSKKTRHPSDTVGSIANTTERRAVINWRGTAGDHRWSNPANWEGGHVPGASEAARFTAHSKSDASVDGDSVGMIAGLELEQGYRGTITLKRDLSVNGDVVIAGGSLNQGDHSLSARHYSQSGGTFSGGAAKFVINDEANVNGGLLITPTGLMRADSLTIEAPGVVRMAANSKLELSGSGEP